MFTWFNEKSVNLSHFKPVIDELKRNGRVDSGTKIAFLNLLKDLDSFDFYKLDHVEESCEKRGKTVFFTKMITLRFDLKLCSAREFLELMANIDNGAINFIMITNLCQITLRNANNLTIKNLMGEIEATIESEHERNLSGAEFYLRRLADIVNFRLAKKKPEHISSLIDLKMLFTPAPNSSLEKILAAKPKLQPKIINLEPQELDCAALLEKMNIKINTSVPKPKESRKKSKGLPKNVSTHLVSFNDDSILDMSSSSKGSSSSTPLTSSPISSSSNAKLSFKGEKKLRKKRRSHKKRSSSDSDNGRKEENNVKHKVPKNTPESQKNIELKQY
jgi:hypothetical protein